jgi:Zn-finger nucleic acid-binding protein
MWLDRDEIRELSDKSDRELADLKKIVDQVDPGKFKPPTTVDHPCPACTGKLTVAILGPIYVEHCSACDGLYLDKGELDKAIRVLRVRGGDIATIAALARSVVTRGSIGG